MLTRTKVGLTGFAVLFAAAATGWMPSAVRAATTSDQGAAILVWAKVETNTNPALGPLTDTVIEIANLDRQNATAAHCFYVNSNSHCANTGAVCTSGTQCTVDSTGFAPCVPGWIEIDFDVILTPNQPLGWSASEGLGNNDLPCPGRLGSRCSGNEGTRVPPVTEDPFIGELKCVQVDPITRFPSECTGAACQNDLAGSATIFVMAPGTDIVDGESYNAVGIHTLGDNDGNRVLTLGGMDAEYEPCHEVLILNHLFDGATDPISGVYTTESELSLVPCTEDFLTQGIDVVTAQFLVYNEFEQRFSTSRQVRCQLDSVLSRIDTSQPSRSIFNANVSGTLAGQTRIRGVGGGLIGAAVLNFSDGGTSIGGAGYNLNGFADRSDSDTIRLP